MPATSEDALSSSSDDELDNDDDQISPGGGRMSRKGSTSSTLIDRVVQEKRDKFQPSPYAKSYGDYEGDEEWTHLLARDHRDDDDDLMTSTGPVSATCINPMHAQLFSTQLTYMYMYMYQGVISKLLYSLLQKRSLFSSIRRHIGKVYIQLRE